MIQSRPWTFDGSYEEHRNEQRMRREDDSEEAQKTREQEQYEEEKRPCMIIGFSCNCSRGGEKRARAK